MTRGSAVERGARKQKAETQKPGAAVLGPRGTFNELARGDRKNACWSALIRTLLEDEIDEQIVSLPIPMVSSTICTST